MTTKKLKILQSSLIKKTAKLDAHFKTHFDHVAMANGQPMDDKRNGRAFFKKLNNKITALGI